MKARLVYVVGASGSGKDSLMRFARTRLATNPAVVFAHRYITREADAGGENHVALSAEEFAARRRAGLFALDWESHGHAYGIGIEINQWLAKGVTVVVNGSREYLPQVQEPYPELLAVSIHVPPEILRARLTARGRESADAIDARLERHRMLQDQMAFGMTINNDGELAEGGKALVDLILHCSKEALCA
jgi:ribose 1,5-bisphosphokinase